MDKWLVVLVFVFFIAGMTSGCAKKTTVKSDESEITAPKVESAKEEPVKVEPVVEEKVLEDDTTEEEEETSDEEK